MICALALVVGGLGPALLLASRGDAVHRLVGLELTSAVAVVFMMVFTEIAGQSYYLSVPLVLAPMSLAGTLVYTRLLGRGGQSA